MRAARVCALLLNADRTSGAVLGPEAPGAKRRARQTARPRRTSGHSSRHFVTVTLKHTRGWGWRKAAPRAFRGEDRWVRSHAKGFVAREPGGQFKVTLDI